MVREDKAPGAVSLAAVQAYVRVETGEEEALLAGLVRSASALCEQFIGSWLMQRDFTQTLVASGGWQKLGPRPVQAITRIDRVEADGSLMALDPAAYAIDIDTAGMGYVRLTGVGSARRIAVNGTAGMANDPNDLPEPVRQGIIRLTSHLFAHRDGEPVDPPAAVTALWRPYREVRL